jgi:hypothetical protein
MLLKQLTELLLNEMAVKPTVEELKVQQVPYLEWCVLTKRTDEPPEGARRPLHAAPFQRVKVPSR